MSLLNKSLKVFKQEFSRVLRNRNDKRKLDLIMKGDKGKFSNFISQTEKFCFSCTYDKIQIEIYYDDKQIQKKYLNQDLKTSDLEDIFSYLALHEYGHSLFCQSTQELKFYWEYQNNIINSFENFNWFVIARCFSEFFADYKVKEIGGKMPEFFIENCLKWLKKKGGIDFYYVMLLPYLNSEQLDPIMKDSWLKATLNNLRRFYIWEEWSLIKPIFQEFDLYAILDFLQIIFMKFNFLCENHSNLVITRDKLVALFRFLDQQQFNDLILKKILSEEIKQSIKEFYR